MIDSNDLNSLIESGIKDTIQQNINNAVEKMKSLGFKLDETQVKQALRTGGTFLNVGEHLFYK